MHTGLWLNHLKIAFRNLRRNRGYSLINIVGLALGLAGCLLVFSYTQFEKSYDQNHPDVDRLYRVNQTAIWNPEGGVMGSTAPPVAALLKDKFPEIEAVTRINTPGSRTIRYQDRAFNESEILAADSNFFDFFAFELASGNAQTALDGVGKVILSAEAATKYFGQEPALGKTLELGDPGVPVQVTGVTMPHPENQHFTFDFLISMPTNLSVKQFDWSFIWTQVVTYVKLQSGADAKLLESKFADLAEANVQPTFSRLGMNYHDFVDNKGGWHFYLQPVKDIHLKSDGIGNRIGPTGDEAIVRLMGIVALLILVIALLNFVNLSTARASTRAKEIGVKKTMGAMKNTLVGQFLMESITVAALATILALTMMKGLQFAIHYATGILVPTDYVFSWQFVPLLLIIPIAIGLVAGLYPAFYLSAFRPMQVLKGKLVRGVKSASLRNVLVTAQFTISIALVAGTVLTYQQLNYINDKNLGFNEENILVINHAEKLGDQLTSFQGQIEQLPGVSSAALAMEMPGRGMSEDIFEREGSDIKLPINQVKIDEQYFPTMGLTLESGRAFEEGRPGDHNSVIINETTERLFDWEDGEALGKKILYPGYQEPLKVIGVVKDFHFQSLRESITPLMFLHINAETWGDQRVLAVKYRQEEAAQVLGQLEQAWDRIRNDLPFEYSYYDEELTKLYAQEQSLSGLISIFSGFSLFIAIIGLVGLLTFAAEQRRKEIGIRKVLGASIFQVFLMLNRQYFLLFLLALVLAIPLSWQTLQGWLNSFAYRIEMNVFVFLLAGLLVILLSFLSVTYLSLKAARVNLAEVLKDE